jgi:hypothetical protein
MSSHHHNMYHGPNPIGFPQTRSHSSHRGRNLIIIQYLLAADSRSDLGTILSDPNLVLPDLLVSSLLVVISYERTHPGTTEKYLDSFLN